MPLLGMLFQLTFDLCLNARVFSVLYKCMFGSFNRMCGRTNLIWLENQCFNSIDWYWWDAQHRNYFQSVNRRIFVLKSFSFSLSLSLPRSLALKCKKNMISASMSTRLVRKFHFHWFDFGIFGRFYDACCSENSGPIRNSINLYMCVRSVESTLK